MEIKETKAYKMLFLCVLSQTMINLIEDDMPMFKHQTKALAKRFSEQLVKNLNFDFNSTTEISQLHDLSIWLEDIFAIMMKVGELNDYQKNDFQKDWDFLLKKHRVNL
jgi:uncharacterized protein YejL (UPF0352 family)